MTVRVRAFRLEDVFALRSEGDFTNLFRAPVPFYSFSSSLAMCGRPNTRMLVWNAHLAGGDSTQ
jgi:hypothetical protein